MSTRKRILIGVGVLLIAVAAVAGWRFASSARPRAGVVDDLQLVTEGESITEVIVFLKDAPETGLHVSLPEAERLGLVQKQPGFGFGYIPVGYNRTVRISGNQIQSVTKVPREGRRLVVRAGASSAPAR